MRIFMPASDPNSFVFIFIIHAIRTGALLLEYALYGNEHLQYEAESR